MSEDAKTVVKGLKGIKAADSSICDIDGEIGKLIYRGYNIDDLCAHSTYEEVAFLLLYSELPNQTQLDEFHNSLTAHATAPPEVLAALRALPKDVAPMAALRTAVSVLGHYDPLAEEESDESNKENAVRLIAVLPTLTAAIRRLRDGHEPIAPKPELSIAANFMYMLSGEEPSEDAAKAMDLILILHAEHGFNASTFSARVIIATLTDMYSAITGAIGALKGKLHGGANTEVLKTLESVGGIDDVAGWVADVRSRKGKFMGFGHAVYQTQDPRAKHLKEYSKKLGQEAGDTKCYDLSIEIESQVVAVIGRQCNVDFFSASVQHYMGIPGDLFTCIFASSRISGWCAHVLEQISDNKIIRPSSHYTGPDERPYVRITER
ncbi:MAG: citrate/2-methylcitrate synthase [Planctomycetaceae bacterium]|jgi:citrate synthase|nr:citrate synthase [Planctomycetaceae bacterium]MDG2390274.1 citrate/2-methylcitrate synthase [Planctomycetaceae bacterium]